MIEREKEKEKVICCVGIFFFSAVMILENARRP